MRNSKQDYYKSKKTIENINKDETQDSATKPSYYKQYPVESIDMMIAIWGKDKVKDFCLMNAFKYRMRLGHKDSVEQDMAKEKWYLDKAAELTEKK